MLAHRGAIIGLNGKNSENITISSNMRQVLVDSCVSNLSGMEVEREKKERKRKMVLEMESEQRGKKCEE